MTGVVGSAQCDRHGGELLGDQPNQITTASGKPNESHSASLGIRSDLGLYEDGDEWIACVQWLQAMPVWMMAMAGFSFPLLVIWLARGVDLTYWLALLGGTLGCFLDWNRSEPRKLSGSFFQQLMLRGFQPLAAAIYGLLTVLLLRSGVVNLKPADVSEPIYLFLAAVLAGYGGQHGSDTMQRLTKALSRPE